MHSAPGSVHVRPVVAASRTDGGWLQRHRGGLGRCLPSLLVVGSQRSGLASVHYALRRGWHSGLRVNGGERELHFFSMDNRYKLGLLNYEQRFHPDSSARSGCAPSHPAETSSLLLAEVSSTYFDYPKAATRIAAVLPNAKVVIVLREPVERAFSAYNLRWMTWLCGKLIFKQADCWWAVTSEEAIKTAQVGPFQMRAALKLYRSCSGKGGGKSTNGAPSLKCLQADYLSKLRDKFETELRTLQNCQGRAEETGTPASVDWLGCLKLRSVMLGPKQMHKVLEDSSFVWRSMYAAQLRGWLRLFPPDHLHVTDPSTLLSPETSPAAMRRLVRFAGLSDTPGSDSTAAATASATFAIRDELLTEPSNGAKEMGASRGIHENARPYIVGAGRRPADVTRALKEWLHVHACDLAGLLIKQGLVGPDAGSGHGVLPWLRDELDSARHGLGGVCAGVKVVSEWFVGSS